jgi:DNA invertase Pin-like site-specific DNA recombinase
MTVIGYARVSTTDQDLSIQQAALKAAGCEVCRELNELCESELNEDHLLNALEKISRALKALSHRFDRRRSPAQIIPQ